MPKFYTYTVTCSFEMQYTFREDQIEQAEEGREGDLDPTEQALEEVADEIRKCLEQQWGVTNVEAWADFDCLLGVDERD